MAEYGHSQNAKVTISRNNAQLESILDEIESQTNYLFIYKEDVDVKLNRSVKVKNTPVSDVLNLILNETSITYKTEGNHIILTRKSISSPDQQQRVSGMVKDKTGEPLIGVTVVVKGTTQGNITDIDGKFDLAANVGDIVQFSYIGYVPQEIKLNNLNFLDIVLHEDVQLLDEVVVVGYGVQKKSDLTGAVVRADLTSLKNSANINIANSLKGTVAGFNVGTTTSAGDSPELSIRGRNSISGTTNPLIVLDGIIYRGNINDINPADIESVDILKDASSSAIYGSQAANGVMLITTKSVKEMSKPMIEYNGTFTFQQLMNPDMKPLNRSEYLNQIEHADLINSRLGSDYLQKNPDWSPTSVFTLNSISEGYANGTDTDWWGLLTEDVPYIQNHNISLRGKNELSAYYLSFGLLDQKNLIKNDTYKRYNLRANIDSKVTNWLKVGTQAFFSYNDMSGVAPNYGRLTRISALTSPYNENGELIRNLDIGLENPLSEIQRSDTDLRYNLTGNFYAEVDFPFIKGLSYRANYSHNLTFYKKFGFDPVANSLQGQGYKNNSSEYAWTMDNILTYKRNFGKHDINATLVYGVEKRGYENTNATANYFQNPTLGYDYLQAGQSDQNSIQTGAWEERSLYMMGRLGYTFNDRYIVNATLRRDGFSGFGASNKFAIFPSAAVAWRISEEDFLKNNIKWINNLKLRASYGSNGNRTAGRYATLASMTSGNGYIYGSGTPELVMGVNAMPNQSLKWETTKSLNIGLDFSVLSGRISGSYETYISNTHNLLYNINIPAINGSTSVTSNIGKLRNKGHEFTLTGFPVRNKDFEWITTVTFSLNRNKIVSIFGLDADGDGKEDDLVDSKIFINKPYGVVYDYNIIGMWQITDYNAGTIPNGFTFGTYMLEDVNGDGNYSAANDRKILGYTDPSYRFNIQNTFTYKGIELRLVVNSIQGGSKYYYGQPLKDIYTGSQIKNYSFFNNFDYWLPENPNAKFQQLGWTGGITTSPYVQRSFIRLQELTLAYNFPAPLLKKAGINRARAFFSANNLFTITDWDGWDPEAGIGVTGSNAPMKHFTFGLNYEF
ncbi:MAG: TonB-dependent receptor [Tannerella sp.]|nr:TonB-dependent receptor [Tannerella sp.]